MNVGCDKYFYIAFNNELTVLLIASCIEGWRNANPNVKTFGMRNTQETHNKCPKNNSNNNSNYSSVDFANYKCSHPEVLKYLLLKNEKYSQGNIHGCSVFFLILAGKKYLWYISSKRIFSQWISKFCPIFEFGEKAEITNYLSISVPPFFYKI